MPQEAAARAHRHHPGRAKTVYVNHALKALRKTIEDEEFTSVAVPKLAIGVGGLEWKDVKPLIEKHLADLKIPIFVYEELHKGVSANETSS